MTGNFTCENTINEFLPFSVFNWCHRYTSVKKTVCYINFTKKVWIQLTPHDARLVRLLYDNTASIHKLQVSSCQNLMPTKLEIRRLHALKILSLDLDFDSYRTITMVALFHS